MRADAAILPILNPLFLLGSQVQRVVLENKRPHIWWTLPAKVTIALAGIAIFPLSLTVNLIAAAVFGILFALQPKKKQLKECATTFCLAAPVGVFFSMWRLFLPKSP